MSAPDKTKQEIQLDPTEVLAQMSFKLAEVFQAANYEFNPTAIAAREARAKASVNLDNVQIDFGVGKPK